MIARLSLLALSRPAVLEADAHLATTDTSCFTVLQPAKITVVKSSCCRALLAFARAITLDAFLFHAIDFFWIPACSLCLSPYQGDRVYFRFAQR